MIYEYKGSLFPDYLKHGNAVQFVVPAALQFCKGRGLDIGAGRWPLPGAIPVELQDGGDAMNLPEGLFDFVFSSHCLEHLANPVAALEHWKSRLRPGGVLFLSLPHPTMTYWLPQHCRKHLHQWWPQDMAQMVRDLGFKDVIHSERDLSWSFQVVGFKPTNDRVAAGVVVENKVSGVSVTPAPGGVLRVDMIPELLAMIDADQARRAAEKIGRP